MPQDRAGERVPQDPAVERAPQDPAVEPVVPGMPRRSEDDPALAAFPASAPATRRWCFADQLGPHFLDRPDQPVLLIESKAVFARRRFHRQKAHLVLSALRHRAAELGEQAEFHQVRTYAEALDRVREPLSVCAPTTWSSRDHVLRRPDLTGAARGERDRAEQQGAHRVGAQCAVHSRRHPGTFRPPQVDGPSRAEPNARLRMVAGR